jgi:hypothetical protein
MPDMAILLACLGESFDSGDVFKWVCWEMSVYYRETQSTEPPLSGNVPPSFPAITPPSEDVPVFPLNPGIS